MSEYLIAFSSTHDGIAARKALRGRCPHTLLPTPRAITASCGVAVLIPEEALPTALALLRDVCAFPDGAALYRATGERGAQLFSPVPPCEYPLP